MTRKISRHYICATFHPPEPPTSRLRASGHAGDHRMPLPPRPPWSPSSLRLVGLADDQCASFHHDAVEPGHRVLGLGVIRHLDKTKAPRAAGLAMGDQVGGPHRPIGGEDPLQLLFRDRPREIPDKQTHGLAPYVWTVADSSGPTHLPRPTPLPTSPLPRPLPPP